MRTTTGMGVLVAAALVLGLAKVPLLPAVVLWVVTAGTVYAIERLLKRRDKPTGK